MSVAISWANKMQLAKCDIMVGFPISSHIYNVVNYIVLTDKACSMFVSKIIIWLLTYTTVVDFAHN